VRRTARTSSAGSRRIIGCQQLSTLAVAVERDLASSVTTEEVATLTSAWESHQDRRQEFYDGRGTPVGSRSESPDDTGVLGDDRRCRPSAVANVTKQ